MTLVVQVPDKLSHEAKELLRQFDEQSGDTLNAVKNASGDTPNDNPGKGKGKKKIFK